MNAERIITALGIAALAAVANAGFHALDDHSYLGLEHHHQSYDSIDGIHGYAENYDHGDYHVPADYTFEYGVHDPLSGDIKSQHETRQGDHVVGHYSVKEADGTTRHVHYSDDGHGFKAVVSKSGHPTFPAHGAHHY